jgi:hypothetical protein
MYNGFGHHDPLIKFVLCFLQVSSCPFGSGCSIFFDEMFALGCLHCLIHLILFVHWKNIALYNKYFSFLFFFFYKESYLAIKLN